MRTLKAIDPLQFVAAVQPHLARNDQRALIELLSRKWTVPQIVSLLKSDNAVARKVAALCVGLVAGPFALDSLLELLKEPDPITRQMAEHSMWSIWFRGGCDLANCELAKGSRCVEQRKFDCAFKHLNRAIELAPAFAEPYNQRAIVHYLSECFERSLIDCRRTVELMPCHFGAWAGMGHCYAHLGKATEAVESYRKALTIHPGLDGIRQAVNELQCHM